MNLNVEALPELTDATPWLGDRAALDALWAQNGYWLFRQVLDQGALTRLRDTYLQELKRLGVVDADETAPRYNGASRAAYPKPTETGHDIFEELARDGAWSRFVSEPEVAAFFDTLLGETQLWVPVIEYRLLPPEEDLSLPRMMAPHQDGFTTEGYESRTCWIPVWNIPRSMGGLAVAEGMHRFGYFHDASNPPIFPMREDAVPDAAWRTADYAPGDVLIFDRRLPHAGLRNHSRDQFRLSLDVRCAPARGCPVLMGTLEDVRSDGVALRRAGGDVLVLTLDDDSLCRNVGAGRGSISRAEVPSSYRVGDYVMIVAEAERIKLLRRPKY
jgi:hypothetical protein